MALLRKKPVEQPGRRRQVPDASPQPQRQTFRRNQTLTGSTSNQVSSSAEFSAQILSPRAHAHHLHRHRQRLIIRLAIVLVACLALYVFIGQLIASEKLVLAKTASVSESQKTKYVDVIEEYLNARPSERFYPALNQDDLLAYVQEKYPEVESVTMKVTGELGIAESRITLREPVARWSIRGKEEYVDRSGHVFGVNGYAQPLIEIVDQAGASAGQSIVTSNRFLSFVGQTVGEMQSRGYSVRTATIPLLTTRQIELGVDGVGYPIKMATDRSAGEQSEDSVRVITYLKQKGVMPGYVDVRVKGKAYYK